MSNRRYEEKLYNRESLMIDVTEDLLFEMEKKNITKSQLAKTLGKSKSFITQTLSGSRNLTLRTLADITFALGLKTVVSFETNGKAAQKVEDACDCSVTDDDNIFYTKSINQLENIINVDFSKKRTKHFQSKPIYKNIA